MSFFAQTHFREAGVICSKRLLNQAVGKSLRTHEERSASYEKK